LMLQMQRPGRPRAQDKALTEIESSLEEVDKFVDSAFATVSNINTPSTFFVPSTVYSLTTAVAPAEEKLQTDAQVGSAISDNNQNDDSNFMGTTHSNANTNRIFGLSEEPSFELTLKKEFSGAVEYREFLKRCYTCFASYGFQKDGCLAVVSVCRDELTRPFADEIQRLWGSPFDISSLGGMPFCGKTGLKAATQHAVKGSTGKFRYVFFVGPHIGITAAGEAGAVERHAKLEEKSLTKSAKQKASDKSACSPACGALVQLFDEFRMGKVSYLTDSNDIDLTDVEQSMLKQRLMASFEYGEVPSLVELTYRAQSVSHEMVKSLVWDTVRPNECDYIVVSPILVHGAEGDYVWCDKISGYINERPTDLCPEVMVDI